MSRLLLAESKKVEYQSNITIHDIASQNSIGKEIMKSFDNQARPGDTNSLIPTENPLIVTMHARSNQIARSMVQILRSREYFSPKQTIATIDVNYISELLLIQLSDYISKCDSIQTFRNALEIETELLVDMCIEAAILTNHDIVLLLLPRSIATKIHLAGNRHQFKKIISIQVLLANEATKSERAQVSSVLL